MAVFIYANRQPPFVFCSGLSGLHPIPQAANNADFVGQLFTRK